MSKGGREGPVVAGHGGRGMAGVTSREREREREREVKELRSLSKVTLEMNNIRKSCLEGLDQRAAGASLCVHA